MAHVIADRVRETSTSTGTGAFTVAGAVTGFRAFSSVCSVGDTCFYAIEQVDGVGAPNGDWEVGYGTYSALNTLTRTTVLASSNAGAVVNFSAGTKNVFVSVPATQAAWIRERVTADRTYYVRTNGNDSNDGKADTSGGAFLTIQRAVDVVAGTLDIAGGVTVTIKVANGTYTNNVTLRRITGQGAVIVEGNTATPDSCVINVSTTAIIARDGVVNYTVRGFRLVTTSGASIFVQRNSCITIASINFSASAGTAISASHGCVVIATSTTIQVAGSLGIGFSAADNSVIDFQYSTLSMVSVPSFSLYNVAVSGRGFIKLANVTWSGSASGQRYNAASGSLIWTNGQAAGWIPGSVAGVADATSNYA